MKQKQINKAYGSLKKLKEFSLPLTKAKAIYDIFKAIDVPFQFALEEEQKYLSDFGGTFGDNGTIEFKDKDSRDAFIQRDDELNEMEVDVDITPVTLTESDLGSQQISPSDIENLDGFVNFE